MISLIRQTLELESVLNSESSIGFVPTMGNLHSGHMTLIKPSLVENEITVVSIYVNPTQFNKDEDFDHYPRTLEQDIEKIKSICPEDKKIFIFAPVNDLEIYPHGKLIIPAPGPTKYFEGALREGHFDGMAAVVKRLFEIVKPQNAYFGEKDYQQLLIIKELVKNYNLPIAIKGIPIKREDSGLALAPETAFLSSQGKEKATKLSKTLNELRQLYLSKNGPEDVQTRIKEILASDTNFNYLDIVNAHSLAPASNSDQDFILLGNYVVEEVKLLDNLKV